MQLESNSNKCLDTKKKYCMIDFRATTRQLKLPQCLSLKSGRDTRPCRRLPGVNVIKLFTAASYAFS